jgi:hypothetical protein
VRFAAFDIGHKTYAARIMFVSRVVETLDFWKPHTGKPSDCPFPPSIPPQYANGVTSQTLHRRTGKTCVFPAQTLILSAGVETVNPPPTQAFVRSRSRQHAVFRGFHPRKTPIA